MTDGHLSIPEGKSIPKELSTVYRFRLIASTYFINVRLCCTFQPNKVEFLYLPRVISNIIYQLLTEMSKLSGMTNNSPHKMYLENKFNSRLSFGYISHSETNAVEANGFLVRGRCQVSCRPGFQLMAWHDLNSQQSLKVTYIPWIFILPEKC